LLNFCQLELFWKFLSSLKVGEIDKYRFFKELDTKHVQNIFSSPGASDMAPEFLNLIGSKLENGKTKESDDLLKGCCGLFDFDLDRICSSQTLVDLKGNLESLAIYKLLRSRIVKGHDIKILTQSLFKSKSLEIETSRNLSVFLLIFSKLELTNAQSQTILDALPEQDKALQQEWIRSFKNKLWYAELFDM
jgi:hypothetical protein